MLVLFLLPCFKNVFFIDLILLLFNIPSIVMTDLEFLDQAESALKAIESHCDRINDAGDADIDNQRTGGMITLTFENKSQIVVNLQKPLQEIWLATKHGGYHYKFVDGQWRDTKNGAELFANLSDCASEQAQSVLVFSSF
jgi:CyaY protein